MREVKLPSGAILKINVSPFADSKALYQAIVAETKELEINRNTDMAGLLMKVFLGSVVSTRVETALWACLKRCQYNSGSGDLKIDDQTFEPLAAREDYFNVCAEVTKENVYPFWKNLYAEYQRLLAMIESTPT